MNKIEVATLPGAPNQKGSISYWILDPEKTQEVINRMIYRDKASLDNNHIIGGIIYASKKTDQAEQMKAEMEESSMKYITLANSQYINGVINYIDVLDAQRKYLSSQLEFCEARTKENLAIVSLYKSLGGGWK